MQTSAQTPTPLSKEQVDVLLSKYNVMSKFEIPAEPNVEPKINAIESVFAKETPLNFESLDDVPVETPADLPADEDLETSVKYQRVWDDSSSPTDQEETDYVLIRAGDYEVTDFEEAYIKALFAKFENNDEPADESDDSDSDSDVGESVEEPAEESDDDMPVDESVAPKDDTVPEGYYRCSGCGQNHRNSVERVVTPANHPLMPVINEHLSEEMIEAFWALALEEVDEFNAKEVLSGCMSIVYINQKVAAGEEITAEDVFGVLPVEFKNVVMEILNPDFTPADNESVDIDDESDDESDDEDDLTIDEKPAFDFELTKENLDEFAATVETGTVAVQPLNFNIGGLNFSLTIRVNGTK